MDTIVTTNLRIPQSAYFQVKALAGELGMSVNEYMTFLIKYTTRTRMAAKDGSLSVEKKRQELWEAMERISQIQNKPMGWSEEDEAIYSI
ncbi:MAG: hypothetical protein UV63_C0033G0028 [Microgenomates group bacterium GW2011_GWC1_43_11]|uniref:Uncharacterized protein n=1 Tax=Candidatus Gottesmanbacteria bacterium GW2011_GWB1_44_11c TaxID=1618447 RepID=A0A0G1GVB7_9BACT|nr:MAG: hypothetical protein UV63_C0033G0028 [Microgenomates group bacterium GW2011_GWC1_43_11]KKT38133.1 MAG: hypothetical protein UW22_C0013G0020 [Candidatus Gottesmanbacteria bacterium GW2011_GWB1_44_11c]HCM82628.1 hypothetical protein [Patescibacteria group bacterium]